MKRIPYCIMITVLAFVLSGCSKIVPEANEENSEEKKRTEYKQEFQKKYLPLYSDIRPFQDVISEREAVGFVIDKLFDDDFYRLEEKFENIDDKESIQPGDIILVQNFTDERPKENSYYYIFTIKICGWIWFEGNILASTNEYTVSNPSTESEYGRVCYQFYSRKYNIPTQYISKEEALKLLKTKFSLADSVKAEIKAVAPFTSFNSWVWAIKFDSSINLKNYYGIEVTTQSLWYNPVIYDLTWNSPFKDATVFDILKAWYPDHGKLGYFEADPFDPSVVSAIQNFKFENPPYYQEYFNRANYEKAFEVWSEQYDRAWNEIALHPNKLE